MNKEFIQLLFYKKLITDEEKAALHEQHKQPISLFADLHVLLYTGVLLLATGFGILIYKNINEIGHGVVVAIIALLCVGSYTWSFKHSQQFSTTKTSTDSNFTDYVLLFGSLLLLTLIGYLQFQYNFFGSRYELATFVPMVLLFISAYYFDHLGVLSMAITMLATWAGLSVAPNQVFNNDFTNPRLIFTGAALGIVLYLAGYASEKRKFKAHFCFTYKNFAVHILMISLLAGMFHFESTSLLWILIIAGVSAFLIKQSLKERSFYFFIIVSLYAYTASFYLFYLLLQKMPDEVSFYFYCLWSIGSGVGFILLLININKSMKDKKR